MLTGTALLAVLLAAGRAGADPVKQFTGYTRPGAPNDTRSGNKIRLVAQDPDEKVRAIGGTLYYMVLEQGQGGGGPWGGGIADLAARFKPGVNFKGDTSGVLDTRARYLYLYQTVNDRGTDLPVQSASVELLVDLKRKDITSWGSFSGVGFATPEGGPRPRRGEVLPVSFTHVAGPERDRIYRSPAPAVPLPQPFRLVGIPERRQPVIEKGPGGVSVVREVLDPANDPDYVMILSGAGGDRPVFRALWARRDEVVSKGGARSTVYGLKPGARSTVYGFTSRLPPTLVTAEVRGGRSQGTKIVPAATGGTERTPTRGAEGEVPTPKPDYSTTPVAAETPAAEPPARPSGPPPLNPPVPPPLLGTGFGSLSPSTPIPIPTPASTGAAVASPGGGGTGGGSGSGSGSGTSTTPTTQGTQGQTQGAQQMGSQQQTVSLVTAQPTPGAATQTQTNDNNVSVSVRQSQASSQAQAQAQAQQQLQLQRQRQQQTQQQWQQRQRHQRRHGGDPPPTLATQSVSTTQRQRHQRRHGGDPPATAVPEPAACVLALLGLPFLLLLARRKSAPSP